MKCLVCGKELSGQQRKYCSYNCKKRAERRKSRGQAIDVRPRRSHLEWSDEDIQNRINTKSSKIIYCGGYVNSESPMYVYCDDCGQPFKWSARGLRKQRPIQCDNCRQLLSNIKEKEHQEQLDANKSLREEEARRRKKQKEAEYIISHTRVCERCGKTFIGNPKSKYCSSKCLQRQTYSNKEHLRRARINNNNSYHDNISLELLAKRDNNKCWLCGKRVDWNDYKRTSEGYFISGKNYPSQDHVIPLAKGGSHTWDNVRLAHFECNTNKRDNLFTQKENGQIILFC